MYGMPPPQHFQWREVLFPKSTRDIVIPFFRPREFGFRGRAYNITVEVLLTAAQLMNLVLFIPSLVLGAAWVIVMLPAQSFRLFVSPLTFRFRIVPLLAIPAVVSIWLLFLPVKLTNLLIAVIVYLFGPKSGTTLA